MIFADKIPLPHEIVSDDVSVFARVKIARIARGYSIEDLAVTCGLATSEIASIENGDDADPSKLRRIASALRVPETILIRSVR